MQGFLAGCVDLGFEFFNDGAVLLFALNVALLLLLLHKFQFPHVGVLFAVQFVVLLVQEWPILGSKLHGC